MLGNLYLEQMEKRMGIEFPEELKTVLNQYHQSEANNIKEGFWHCFDLPFTFVCGGPDLAELMVKHLSPMTDKIISPLQVSVATIKKGYIKQ
jgi:hypothetical protein